MLTDSTEVWAPSRSTHREELWGGADFRLQKQKRTHFRVGGLFVSSLAADSSLLQAWLLRLNRLDLGCRTDTVPSQSGRISLPGSGSSDGRARPGFSNNLLIEREIRFLPTSGESR
jgi:hypothetical protein